MSRRSVAVTLSMAVCIIVSAIPATAQSFRVQCPSSTITHPTPTLTTAGAITEPAYNGPTIFKCTVPNGCGGTAGNVGYLVPTTNMNGAIKCQQVSGGDGYSTMANGTQTFMFSFGPLSGLADIANGQPGTEFPDVFNKPYTSTFLPGDPATTDGASDGTSYVGATNPGIFGYNGAVGLVPDIANLVSIYDITLETGSQPVVIVQANAPLGLSVGQTVQICGTGTYTAAPMAPCGTGTASLNGYDGSYTVNAQPDGRRNQLRLFRQLQFHDYPRHGASQPGRHSRISNRHRGDASSDRWPRGSTADHGCGRDEREHSRAAGCI